MMIDVDINNIDELKKYQVGFGSYYLKVDEPMRISRMSDITEVKNLDIGFTIPTMEQVKGKKAPSIVEDLSGLAFVISVFKKGDPIIPSLKEVLKTDNKNSTLYKLWSADYKVKNFEKWVPFSPDKVKYGKKITDKSRSQSKYLPIVPINDKLLSQTEISKADNEKLKKGIETLGKSIPLKQDSSDTVTSTPMVHYFLSRYIASLLLPKAREALAVTAKSDIKKLPTLQRITKLNDDLEKMISSAINLSPDLKTEVDAIFDMNPVGSTINYLDENKPAKANDELIIPGDHIEIGLLQKLYSIMPTGRRTKFRENVAEIIKTLDITDSHTYGARSIYTIDTEIFEQVLVWIEEIELGGAKKTQNQKFVSGINNPTGIDLLLNEIIDETVTIGSEIAMPGWMIMVYSQDGGESFLKQVVDKRIAFGWADRTVDQNTGETSGFTQLIQDTYDEEEAREFEGVEDKAYEIAKTNGFLGKIKDITVNEIEITFDIFGKSHTAKMDKGELMKNELNKEETDLLSQQYGISGAKKLGLKSSREMAEHLNGGDGSEIFGEEWLNDAGFILASEDGNMLELAYPRVLELSEEPMGSDIGLSRAFQALGDILMYLVKENAVTAAQKSVSGSAFDRAVEALLGTHNNPGPASYHAQIQHSLLYENAWRALAESDKSGMVALGSNLIFEQYSKNPAKLMVLWMLANYNLIDMGGFNENGQPEFFSVPETKLDKLTAEAGLMNTMAVIIISYYRLAFYPLRLKTKGEKNKDFNLKKEWPRLQIDAKSDGPDPYAFATVLRYLTKSEKLKVEIPAWMPALPKDFSSLDDRTRQKDEVIDFLRWSYGVNPLSKEHFCEIAAAYHAAKALSYYKPGDYPNMIQTFVNAVEAERGEGFLMSVLIAYAEAEKTMSPGTLMSKFTPPEKFQSIGGV